MRAWLEQQGQIVMEPEQCLRSIRSRARSSATRWPRLPTRWPLALYRTAYSTIVRDCLDYSTSLCDADGQMIAQGVTIPLHLGLRAVRDGDAVRRSIGDAIEEGDIFILNDPFDGGMHIPDIFIVKPIFWEGGASRSPSPPRTISIWAAGCPAARPATTPRSFRKACASPG